VFEYESVKAALNYPFCSERCKLMDLGQWFDEEHKIEEPLPAPPAPDSNAEA